MERSLYMLDMYQLKKVTWKNVLVVKRPQILREYAQQRYGRSFHNGRASTKSYSRNLDKCLKDTKYYKNIFSFIKSI